MLYRFAFTLACVLAVALPSPSYAHARWKLDGIVKPRTDSTGLKTAPCGDAPRTATPAVFTPGATITVEWEETINHPGYFRIAFSPAGDQNFDSYILADNIIDTQDDANTPHFYSRQITLPDQACTDCTLQLIQYMTENPAVPTLYYSCADIRLGMPIELPQTVTNAQASPQTNSVVLTWRNPVQAYFQTLVLMSTNPISAAPTDGQTYAMGDALGNATVIYSGANQFFTAQGLTTGQTYYFALVAQDTRMRFAQAATTQATLPVVAINSRPRVSLELLQRNARVSTIATNGGRVIVTANVTDPDLNDRFSFDWSMTDNRLIDTDLREDTFTFDPAALQPGSYAVLLTVMDSGQPPETAQVRSTLRVTASTPSTGGSPTTPIEPKNKTAAAGAWSPLQMLALLILLIRRSRAYDD